MEVWLKIEHATPDKPEVLKIAARLGIDPDSAFGKCFRMWRWFDKETIDGKAVGIGLEAIDHVVGARGFAAVAAEVGWLKIEGGGAELVMPEFAKHCGEGAKRRGLTAWRVAKHAVKTNAELTQPALSEALPRKEKGERREKNSNRDRTDPQKPLGQSPLKNSDSGGREPAFDLSAVDWERVLRMAEAIGKRIPPHTDADRRQWFKFAVMAELTFSEHWLLDSAEAVVNAPRSSKNKQSHFVAVLKSKAAEQDVDASMFRGILRRIEIPADIWKSKVLEMRK